MFHQNLSQPHTIHLLLNPTRQRSRSISADELARRNLLARSKQILSNLSLTKSEEETEETAVSPTLDQPE